jgi:hypothetical protein
MWYPVTRGFPAYVVKFVSKFDLQTIVYIIPFLKKTDIHKAEYSSFKNSGIPVLVFQVNHGNKCGQNGRWMVQSPFKKGQDQSPHRKSNGWKEYRIADTGNNGTGNQRGLWCSRVADWLLPGQGPGDPAQCDCGAAEPEKRPGSECPYRPPPG